jgi:hypothetical protein
VIGRDFDVLRVVPTVRLRVRDPRLVELQRDILHRLVEEDAERVAKDLLRVVLAAAWILEGVVEDVGATDAREPVRVKGTALVPGDDVLFGRS